MNHKLCLKIEKRIRKFPEPYKQESFIHIPDEVDFDPLAFKKRPMCGATACVAGHGAIVTYDIQKELKKFLEENMWVRDMPLYRQYEVLDWDELGRKAFGLTVNQAEWLFSENRSEEDMPDILHDLGTGKKFWKVVVKYDDYYDRSDAKEMFADA